MLVKDWVCTDYDVTIVDKSYDGVLVLRFVHKDSDFDFVIISAYLPPENSPRGRDAQGFYSHILAQVYMLADSDSIFLAGDLNSRLGSLSDIINETDTIPIRRIIDTSINQHGHDMIEFLIEAKFCTLNGRFNGTDDNYTSISTRGKAVVDYICVPHDVLQTVTSFKVLTINSIVNSGQLHGLIGQRTRLPDHSVLVTEFTVSVSSRLIDGCEHKNESNNDVRYKLNKVPVDFMNSELPRNALLEIICKIERCRETQHDVDSLYDNLCSVIRQEMEQKVPKYKPSPKSQKR